MYNRYVGNTGKFVRVKDAEDEEREAMDIRQNQSRAEPVSVSGALSGLFSPLTQSGRGEPFNISLPFGLQMSDLALLALFFFLYLQSGDDEFLILLAAVVLAGVLDR